VNAYCPACRTPVTWAFTKNGKLLALNPEPDPAGNQAAYRDHRPAWLTRQLKDGEDPYGFERRYMPHVATCTGAQQRKAPAALPPNVIPIGRARKR
jgi:hypothetical protein